MNLLNFIPQPNSPYLSSPVEAMNGGEGIKKPNMKILVGIIIVLLNTLMIFIGLLIGIGFIYSILIYDELSIYLKILFISTPIIIIAASLRKRYLIHKGIVDFDPEKYRRLLFYAGLIATISAILRVCMEYSLQ